MKLRLISTVVVFAIMIMRSEAFDQASSGYNADRYTSSGDDDGSGTEGEDVQQVIDAMKKLNKSKSDDDISKNIKTGYILRSIPLRTFEKLSALWISIIRRLWKVWRAKGARHVMHSIVKKLVTHTGEKVSRKVSKLLAESPESDSQKSTLPSEKTVLDYTSENDTVTYAQTGSDQVAQESSDREENLKSNALPLVGMSNTNTQATKGVANEDQRYTSSQKEASSIQVAQSKVGGDAKGPTETEAPERTNFASNAGNKPLTGMQSVKNNDGTPTELDSGGRNSIPQELTPENITANMGGPMENVLQKSNKNVKQIKHKKRYKMHRHAQTKKKSKKYSRDSRVKYKNVDKHLIKRGNKRTQTTKRSDWAERSSYQGPISNQLESVLNAKATREVSYSNDMPGFVQRKRSYPSESRRSRIEDSEMNYDYDYDDSYDENSGVAHEHIRSKQKTPQRAAKIKKRKINKKLKIATSRKSSSRHRTPSKLSKETGMRNTERNRTMVKQAAKYEAPVRKFNFFGRSASNTTKANQGIPILNIESIPTKTTSAENNEGSGREDSQPQSGAPAIPLWQNGPVEQTTPFGAMGQPEANDPNGPNVMLGSPESGVFPVLLVKPTVSQSDVVVPTSSGRPVVPIIPTEEPNMSLEEENSVENPVGNSTSFVPPEDEAMRNKQSYLEASSMMEELRSLESRMTVVETAVAEVIEWIRTRTDATFRDQSPPNENNPSLPDEGDSNAHQSSPEAGPNFPLETLPQETMPLRHARLLKQIFIPLPPPNTEAEREIENGEPVNGLPFPLNFIVSKVLAKMLTNRGRKVPDAHPHTPLPNINIPAIEHDINRLEMELASVPASVHQRKHHMKLVTPDTMKAPLINALVTADPEYDAPACPSPCENGGICSGKGICQCPEPFDGPTCGSVTLVKVVKPTRRVLIEDPNSAILEKLRRRAVYPYIGQVPQQISNHRERRRLVRVLKKLLQKIASENENTSLARRSELEKASSPPYLISPERDGSSNTFRATANS